MTTVTVEVEDIPYVFEQMIAIESGLDGDANGLCNAIWIETERW